MNDRDPTMRRNEYDPRPNLGKADYPGFEWDDGAGRIADAIIADKTLLLRKHADEIAALRASSPAQEPMFDSVAQRIERSEPDEGRRDAGSNPVAIDPAQEPATTEPVGYGYSAQIQSSQGAYIAVSRTKVAHYDTPLYAIPVPPQPGREDIAKAIYDLDPFEESGEYVDGFIVSPGGKLSWEQAKARDAEFADDKIMLPITKFAYAAADAIRALTGEPK